MRHTCSFGNAAAESYFSETFEQKTLSLRRKSDFGHLPGWKLGGLIAKSNDDLRQEVQMQILLTYIQRKLHHTYTFTSTGVRHATADDLRKKFPGCQLECMAAYLQYSQHIEDHRAH